MSAPWWWYPFAESQTTSTGRAMRPPTKQQRERIRQLEDELIEQYRVEGYDRAQVQELLGFAVWRFLKSRDDEQGDDPWKGVVSMWDLFLSQTDVWLVAGTESSALWKGASVNLGVPWIRR